MLYRRTLAAQPDRSVAISSIGIHTNLAALLQSDPDTHSPLNGHNLVVRIPLPRTHLAELTLCSSARVLVRLCALVLERPCDQIIVCVYGWQARKVKLLAVMGGKYPSGYECNLMGGGNQGFGLHNHQVASAASSYVAAHCMSLPHTMHTPTCMN